MIYCIKTSHKYVRIWSEAWIVFWVPSPCCLIRINPVAYFLLLESLEHSKVAKTDYSRNSGPVLVAILSKAWSSVYIGECDILYDLKIRRPYIKGVHSKYAFWIGYIRARSYKFLEIYLASLAIVVRVCEILLLYAEYHQSISLRTTYKQVYHACIGFLSNSNLNYHGLWVIKLNHRLLETSQICDIRELTDVSCPCSKIITLLSRLYLDLIRVPISIYNKRLQNSLANKNLTLIVWDCWRLCDSQTTILSSVISNISH